MAGGTFVVPVTTVFSYVSLPVALHCELQATLITDEGFDASVRSHVLVQQRLSQVSLVAQLALERSLA